MIASVAAIRAVVCTCLLLSLTGCALTDTGPTSRGAVKSNRASASKAAKNEDQVSEIPEEDDPDRHLDKWNWVGKEGRSDRPATFEHDPLSRWIDSPESRAVHANLGYR